MLRYSCELVTAVLKTCDQPSWRAARSVAGVHLGLPPPLGARVTRAETDGSPLILSCSSSRSQVPSGHVAQCPALPTDAAKERERLGIHHERQYHAPGVTDDPARHLHERPPQRGDRVPRPGRRTREALEPDDEVVGDHPEAQDESSRPLNNRDYVALQVLFLPLYGLVRWARAVTGWGMAFLPSRGGSCLDTEETAGSPFPPPHAVVLEAFR